jgi:hypothetical protein
MLPTGNLYEKKMYITVMFLIHQVTVNKGISPDVLKIVKLSDQLLKIG